MFEEFPEYVRHTEDGRIGEVCNRQLPSGQLLVEWDDGRYDSYRLDDKNPEWEALLRKDKAREYLKIIQDYIVKKYGDGMYDEPQLYHPGFHANTWVVALEGPPDWTFDLWNGGTEFPEGVFVEAVNHWSVALYVDKH